jgi:hypothetical protein
MSENFYKQKYLKYKEKYLKLKQSGGLGLNPVIAHRMLTPNKTTYHSPAQISYHSSAQISYERKKQEECNANKETWTQEIIQLTNNLDNMNCDTLEIQKRFEHDGCDGVKEAVEEYKTKSSSKYQECLINVNNEIKNLINKSFIENNYDEIRNNLEKIKKILDKYFIIFSPKAKLLLLELELKLQLLSTDCNCNELKILKNKIDAYINENKLIPTKEIHDKYKEKLSNCKCTIMSQLPTMPSIPSFGLFGKK